MKRQYFNIQNMPQMDPNYKMFRPTTHVFGNPPFQNINYGPLPSPPMNRQVTNNFMIVSQKPGLTPMGQSSSSRPAPSKIGLEYSGSKFKLKNFGQSTVKSPSHAKTNLTYSDKESPYFQSKEKLIHPMSVYPDRYPMMHANPVRMNTALFHPMKSPNLNKNYYSTNPQIKPVLPIRRLNPVEEAETLKKIMQLFLKMDSIRKKEIAVYKKKLIPHFEKLNLMSHRMKTLQSFMEKFLMNERIDQNDIDALNVAEKLVFMAFLVKKKYFDVDCFEFKPEVILFFQDRITMKRNEQEYKIVLKKAFKTMINAFNQESGFYDSSKRHFYKEFFGDFATSQSIPLEDLELENLFNEKGKKKAKKRKSKKNYAQILRTSPRFLKKLSEYLDDRFLIGPKRTGSKCDAVREIKKKVPDLINKWKTRMLMEEDNPPRVQMAEFFAKFFTNKKVKLPWSVNEIKRAVKSVKHLLQIN